jgi:hypothetical protein
MKQGLIAMWLALLVGVLFGRGWVATASFYTFFGIALLHVVEFVAKRRVMERAGGSMVEHFVNTLAFGLAHWKPLEVEQAGAGSSRSSEGP